MLVAIPAVMAVAVALLVVMGPLSNLIIEGGASKGAQDNIFQFSSSRSIDVFQNRAQDEAAISRQTSCGTAQGALTRTEPGGH